MTIYIHPSGVETEVKNIYVWEKPRTPWANTVLYYSFNNDTASTVTDWVGNNDWTWYNNSWTYTTWISGQCAEFSADSNKYISLPTSISYPTTNFTIAFFTYFTWLPDSYKPRPMFSKWGGGGNSNGAYIFIYQSSTGDSNGKKIWVDIPYVAVLFITANDYYEWWHHVCLTKSWNTFTLYIDGTQTNTATNSFSLDWTSTTQWLIGRNNNWNVWINWKIDEFIIENVAWSQQDLTDYLSLFTY